MIPAKGVTPHPGEMLVEEYLQPMGITQAAFAKHIGMDVSTLSALVKGRRNITPTIAIKIGLALGMSPEFWTNLQSMHDLTKTREMLKAKKRMPKIKTMPAVEEAMAAELVEA